MDLIRIVVIVSTAAEVAIEADRGAAMLLLAKLLNGSAQELRDNE